MAEYQIGDRVRVTYEGEVKAARWRDCLVFRNGLSLPLPTATVEVIERRKPKVGDTIEGWDEYDALPEGTVLTAPGRSMIFKTSDGWLAKSGSPSYPSAPRAIAFIPES